MFLCASVNAEGTGLALDMSMEVWCAHEHLQVFEGMCGCVRQLIQGGNLCATMLAYQGMGVSLSP